MTIIYSSIAIAVLIVVWICYKKYQKTDLVDIINKLQNTKKITRNRN